MTRESGLRPAIGACSTWAGSANMADEACQNAYAVSFKTRLPYRLPCVVRDLRHAIGGPRSASRRRATSPASGNRFSDALSNTTRPFVVTRNTPLLPVSSSTPITMGAHRSRISVVARTAGSR